jgi:hypothetical protein
VRIAFLLLTATGSGGTTRVVLSLAGALAARHDVQILSAVSTRPDPMFALDPRVRLRILDDRMVRSADGAESAVADSERAALESQPSEMVNPDGGYYKWFTAWTDQQMREALTTLDADVVVGTRATLSVVVARDAPERLVRIGSRSRSIGRPCARRSHGGSRCSTRSCR